MGRLLDEDDVIDAFAKLLAERCGGNRIWWKPVAEEAVNNLSPAHPNESAIQLAYIRGKIDGIKECKEKLQKLREEFE